MGTADVAWHGRYARSDVATATDDAFHAAIPSDAWRIAQA